MTPIEALRLCAEALGDGFLKPEGREGYHYSCTACGGDLHGDGHAKGCVIGAAVAAAEAALAAEDEIADSPTYTGGGELRGMRVVVSKPKSQDPYGWLGEMLGSPYSHWGNLVTELLCIKDGSHRYARCTGSKQLGAETIHFIETEAHLSDEDFQQVRVNAEHLLEQDQLREFTTRKTADGQYQIHFAFVEPKPR